MAFSTYTVWEVRDTGSATNGGAFAKGASGIDFSQQDSAQISVTDAVANGTTMITSATANFPASAVGNFIYLAGGSGSLAATRRQITVRVSSTTIMVDAAVASGTGITLNMGGAVNSPSIALSSMVNGNTVWIKRGSSPYQTSTGLIMSPSGGGNYTTSYFGNWLIGYATTRGDNGRAQIQLITNTGLTGLTVGPTSGGHVRNIEIDCNNLGTSSGLIVSATNPTPTIDNCKISNFNNFGASLSNCTITSTEVTGGGSGSTPITAGNGSLISRCYIHGNAATGITLTDRPSAVEFCIIVDNTGASTDGIYITYGSNTLSTLICQNTIANNGRDGINDGSFGNAVSIVRGNLLALNGRYGLNRLLSSPSWPSYDGNAYYSNGTAPTNNLSNTDGSWDTSQSFNSNAILTADPFTDSATGDYSLNSVAGGGAAAKQSAIPGAFVGLSQVGYLDFGALQARALAGGISRSRILGRR